MKNTIVKLFGVMLVFAVLSNCKQYDNPPPIFEELQDLTTLQRKVLVISIDGLSGAELQEVAPTNIMALQKNAKYSYQALKSVSSSGGWVSMLTGTDFAKHHISNDNFEAEHDHDHNHGDIKSYRNVLDYVTQYKAVKTAMITSWGNLRNYVRNADFTPVVEDDISVRDSTIALLESEQGLGVVFVNFRDVLEAGANGGYVASNPVYSAAITQADAYVRDVLAAVKARGNYAKEEWLVIVTTNHGGSSENPEDGFVIVHNSAFEEFELKKSGFNPVLFDNKTGRATLTEDNGLYDAGETNSFTVQMDVKFNATPGGYSSFFSKSTNLNGQTITGWQWGYYPGGKWVVTVGGSLNGGSGKMEAASADAPGNSDWHTLTMTVEYVNSSTRTLNMYMDGKFQNTLNISARRSLSTTEEFRIGHRAGDNDVPTSFYAANLTYFNTALDEGTVQSTFGLQDITQHPNYADVIGFWPMDKGIGGEFENQAPGGYNMTLSGQYNWVNLADFFPPSTKPEPITSTLSILATPNDIAALTMYWMRIEILADFGFDGQAYLEEFEMEFLKD